jgi:hypothetical protein
MPSRLRILKTLLVIPIVIIGLSLFLSMFALMGTGTFHADSYYLPLREFVAQPQRDAMESKVIEIYNAHERAIASIWMIRDAVCLVCLLTARLLVTRLGEGRIIARP